MRRLIMVLTGIFLMVFLMTFVSGAEHASQIKVNAVVYENESCQVTVTGTIHVDGTAEAMRYPVPLEATSVKLNGNAWIITTKSGQAQFVDLGNAYKNVVGDFPFTISYNLPDVIHTGSGNIPQLQIPLLSGFEYPIQSLDFSVTLPGEINAKPAFISGYHQSNIEKDLSCSWNSNTVTGRSNKELKDHETLLMTLTVDETLFPNAPIVFAESDFDDKAMVICGILAVLYWIVFLRCLPPKIRKSPSPPEGIGAGELGAVMTLGSADLTMMVFSWAQLGYIKIQANRKDRVILLKTMEMGNERTQFEQKCFKNLFGRKGVVDTSGLYYANQCKQVRKMRPNYQSMVHPRSGNVKLFRFIGALIALFGGVSFAIALTQGSLLQGLWIVVMALIGGVCGWLIQQTVAELFLSKSEKTVFGLIGCGIWLLIGGIAGQFSLALGVLAAELICGILAFYGGRRTDAGRQDFGQIIGLRSYLKTVSKEEIRRISSINPDYFHNLAPYAIALGVDRSFARKFGSTPITECQFISVKNDRRTAAQWSGLLRSVRSAMNRRSRMMLLEKLMEITVIFKK